MHVILAQGKHKTHCTSLEEVSKKSFMTNNLQQWLHTKNVQNYYNENTLSQYLGGDSSTHQGKCHIFKSFLGLDIGVNFPPGRQNPPGIIWKSSEVNWQMCCADLKIHLPDWHKKLNLQSNL